MDDQKKEAKVRAAKARANSLSPERRKEIARKAAESRWNPGVPTALYEGDFDIGGATLASAVLPDGRRLLTQATFLRALGRSRSPKAGTGVLSTVDGLPFFLQADSLKRFLSKDLIESTTPIFYKTKSGKKSVGYDAELLPMVCEVYLKLRDAALEETGKIPATHAHIIKACDVLIRGLAHVGIIALVDEATGYQEFRDKQALQALLDRFLRRELAAWAKTFPDEFYQQIFRLRGWKWKGMKVNRPQVVAHYTKDLVYARLAPGILKELEKKNPIEDGRRKARHFQWLTEDVGHPALAQHLYAVVGLMRNADSWQEFMRMVDKAYPRRGDSIQLSLLQDKQ